MKELRHSNIVDGIMKQEQRVQSPTSATGEDIENYLIQIQELKESIRMTLG